MLQAWTNVCHKIFSSWEVQCEIYRRMCDVYGEAYFSQENVTSGLNWIKTAQTGRSTIVSTPEMVDSVKELILADRIITVENISEQWVFLCVQQTKLCVMTLSLGLTKKMQGSILQQKECTPSVSLVGNNCHILLTGQIWPLCFPFVWPPPRIFAWNKVFKQ